MVQTFAGVLRNVVEDALIAKAEMPHYHRMGHIRQATFKLVGNNIIHYFYFNIIVLVCYSLYEIIRMRADAVLVCMTMLS